jgi:type IV secretory pathway TraG/TraD family ATPase VirD4
VKGYQAHESFWADLKMYAQLFKWAVAIGIISQMFFIVFSYWILAGRLTEIPLPGGHHISQLTIANYMFSFEEYLKIPQIPPRLINVGPELRPVFRNQRSQHAVSRNTYNWVLDQYSNYAFAREKQGFLKALANSWRMYLVSLIYIGFFMQKSRKMADQNFVRGIDITSLDELNHKLSREAANEKTMHIRVGKTILPYAMEPKHISVLGAAGTGKGVLLNQLLNQMNIRRFQNQEMVKQNPGAAIKPRCSKAIIYDMKGEYVAKQFIAGDYIFSPFDERGFKWSFFNEIRNYPDLDVAAKSLYNSPDAKDEYWYNCAKDIFRTGLFYLQSQNRTSNRELWHFFSQPLQQIKAAFQTLPLAEQSALKHIDKADSNQSASIISILQERIQFFKYLVDMDGDFSFRDFVKSGQNACLYLLNIEQYKTIFKPLMTFAIDTLVREILSLEDDLDRRVFFIIDELGSLYRLESILDLLTVGRSKGACLICANQDLGRIEETYGKSNTTTFYNNFNTNFIFRINEPKTADFLSQAIGERQIVKKVESRQLSPSDIGDRKGISDQEKTERVFLATEFQNLADFEAVIKISNFGVSKIKIPKLFFVSRTPHFVMRRFEPPTADAGLNAEQSVKPEDPASAGEVLFGARREVIAQEHITAPKDEDPENKVIIRHDQETVEPPREQETETKNKFVV